MGFWDDIKDALKEGAQEGTANYIFTHDIDQILTLSTPVARRELRHYLDDLDEGGIQRVIKVLDDIARDEDDERSDLAAELAEYAESFL